MNQKDTIEGLSKLLDDEKARNDDLDKKLLACKEENRTLSRKVEQLEHYSQILDSELEDLRNDEDYFLCSKPGEKHGIYHRTNCKYYKPHGENDNWDVEAETRSALEKHGHRPCLKCVYE